MSLIACETRNICVYPLSLSTSTPAAGRLPTCPAAPGSPLKFLMSTITTATSFVEFNHMVILSHLCTSLRNAPPQRVLAGAVMNND